MEDVRDPYWKINPDVVAEESAADRYEQTEIVLGEMKVRWRKEL